MSYLLSCDGCTGPIDEMVAYFGVDDMRPFVDDPGIIDEADHEGEGATAVMFAARAGAHEFHFCSVTCLTTWAMSRTLDEQGAPE